MKIFIVNGQGGAGKSTFEYIIQKYAWEEDFKDILFGKPSHYPAILATHFNISMCKFINHKVYGEYIYLSSFG